MLNGFNKIGKAIEQEGKFHYQYVVKTTTPTPSTAGFFVDMSQTSGVPKYNAFAGSQATFTPLIGGGNNGVYCGTFKPNSTKHLLKWQALNANTGANTTSPDYVYLLDYLGFYSLIDCDDVDVQLMDNTSTLPRYADGSGVQIVLVVTAPMVATAAVTITYTNQDGVTGRTSTHNVIPGLAIGVCATGTGGAGAVGNVTPFFPLAGNDTGVRAIEQVQFAASAGGFVCACLVRPLAEIQLYEANVPTEKIYGIDEQKVPEIKEGAYLNFIIQRSGTGAGSLRSELIFIDS